MNKQMKRWLKGAVFIGFTGTPLLRKDKLLTRDVFGTYIHTYKFHEGVADGVILDLKYEARDVPQRLAAREGPPERSRERSCTDLGLKLSRTSAMTQALRIRSNRFSSRGIKR